MGEAKTKRQSFAKLLAQRPGCIYCAGAAVADTIEHMPPVAMFEERQRPRGLEFPACLSCNGGTKHSDLVAALVANSWPNADSIARQSDLKRLLSGVANNVPGLLQEMMMGRGAEKIARKQKNIPDEAHPLRVGPKINQHMFTFAAKFGFALHHEVFGAPIPQKGGVQAMWFSNVQALNDEIPAVLTQHLPAPTTLQQGTKSVGDQFRYSHASIESGDHMLYFASFNLSFAVAGITALDRSVYIETRKVDHMPVFAPGFARREPTDGS